MEGASVESWRKVIFLKTNLCEVIRIISVWNYYTKESVNLEFVAPLSVLLATKGTEVLYECCGGIYAAIQCVMEVNLLTVSLNFDPSRLDTPL